MIGPFYLILNLEIFRNLYIFLNKYMINTFWAYY